MASPHFQFLQSEWPLLLDSAAQAERMVNVDPRASCFYTRRTLEMAVVWLYTHNKSFRLPYQDNLSALIHDTVSGMGLAMPLQPLPLRRISAIR